MRPVKRGAVWLAAALLIWCGATPAATAGEILLRLMVTPHRDVWYVGEPIQLGVSFGNLSQEATLVNLSPAVLATAVFEVSYDGQTHRFTAPSRAFGAPRYNMLGASEETSIECALVEGAAPFGAIFEHRYYGALPRRATEITVRLIYQNTDTGTRNVVPFWTGQLVSDPALVIMAVR